MSKNKTNKTAGNSNTKNKSLKGKRNGVVGAPPKPVKFPSVPFTIARLVSMNKVGKYAQCELSLRTKLSDGLAKGEIVCLKPKKQPKGSVGRPAPVYVLAENYDAEKMVVWTPPTKPVRKSKTETVSTESVPVVEVAPVVPATAPVSDVVSTAPTPVNEQVVVVNSPETPTAEMPSAPAAEEIVPVTTSVETVVA
jgi:hypothetical protein